MFNYLCKLECPCCKYEYEVNLSIGNHKIPFNEINDMFLDKNIIKGINIYFEKDNIIINVVDNKHKKIPFIIKYPWYVLNFNYNNLSNIKPNYLIVLLYGKNPLLLCSTIIMFIVNNIIINPNVNVFELFVGYYIISILINSINLFEKDEFIFKIFMIVFENISLKFFSSSKKLSNLRLIIFSIFFNKKKMKNQNWYFLENKNNLK